MILHDQHVHSQYSEDSEALLDEYYEFAKKLGCKYFVTTEHIDFMPAYSDHDWICDFDLLKKHLDKLNQDGGPKCLLGIEMGYRKDYLNQKLQLYILLSSLPLKSFGKYSFLRNSLRLR